MFKTAMVFGVLGLVAAGCHKPAAAPAAPATPAPAPLTGSSWLLEDLGGKGVIDNAQSTIAFAEGGKVSGRGGCNRYFGTVEVSGEKLHFGPMGSTKMACPPALMDQEDRFLKALQDAERYKMDGAFLLIYCKGLEKPLRFTRSAT
jgi:heat shock protein HslJ